MAKDSGLTGILNLYKPVGMTSHDAVAAVRRLAGTRRVGHAGTLDPAAEGVLPICLGQATRIVEYLSDATKAYRATIALGLATPSFDLETAPDKIGDDAMMARLHNLTQAEVEAVLAEFVGPQTQLPPMYSAVQIGGQRLYDLARAGQEVERTPRPITIYQLDLMNMTEQAWQTKTPEQAAIYNLQSIIVDVTCSKGTYIRTLAVDIGARLGTPAVLGHLLRTRSATFGLDTAYKLELLAEMAAAGRFADALLPADTALADLPRFDLDATAARRVTTGQTIPAEDEATEGQLARAYAEGRFIAILRREGATWRPDKVFVG